MIPASGAIPGNRAAAPDIWQGHLEKDPPSDTSRPALEWATGPGVTAFHHHREWIGAPEEFQNQVDSWSRRASSRGLDWLAQLAPGRGDWLFQARLSVLRLGEIQGDGWKSNDYRQQSWTLHLDSLWRPDWTGPRLRPGLGLALGYRYHPALRFAPPEQNAQVLNGSARHFLTAGPVMTLDYTPGPDWLGLQLGAASTLDLPALGMADAAGARRFTLFYRVWAGILYRFLP